MAEFLDHNSPFSISEGIYYILVASLGIPSNLLSIVVLCSQRCGMSRSTVIYLVSLALVDTVFMVLGGLVDVGASWQESVTSQAPSSLLCGFVTFNEQWTQCSSQWIVALVLVLASAFGSQVLSLPYCWLYQAPEATDEAESWTPVSLLWRNVSQVLLSSRCRVLHAPRVPGLVWSYLLLSSWLPMSLTLSLSVLLSLHFHKRARSLVAPRSSAPFRDAGSRMRRSGRIQVVVALVMVFLNLPHYVTQGIMAALLEQARRVEGALGVAVGAALMLQWLSMVIHFLLYCFLSSGFRRETLALLRRLCRCSAVSRYPWSNRCTQRPQRPQRPPTSQPCEVWLVQEVPDDHGKWQS
ncbi:hypothetical protein ANANG_G00175480 [Anguilla anguilla]|uniref:G-protein coupled receptors family 1 profile domain-containing protein n=1 Tax=Anguilla anguilla TaxID=7936 RepID=A0A9D3RT97_ANGAN|nr:hypothetical protein ANANG_G00175480 [Anguilla anguilla]